MLENVLQNNNIPKLLKNIKNKDIMWSYFILPYVISNKLQPHIS